MQRELNFPQFALINLYPFAAQFPIQYVNGKQNCQIAYQHFKHKQIERPKLLILVNGRAENLLKWTEIAYDFYHQGYDVLLFDHRGQGYSQRLLKASEKGYIDEFRFYVDDMANLIEKVTTCYNYQSQHILAHSLGALISTYYLANYDHYIKNAVFSAPFYGMPFIYPRRDELIINLMLLFGQGERYVFGKTAYQPIDPDDNELSSCKARITWINELNSNYPKINLGGPTFRWVHVCNNMIKQLPQVIPQIEIPVLILKADKEKIVSNKNLEKLTALFAKGNLEQVADAKHEIFFEKDSLRKSIFQRICTYFSTGK